MLTFRCPACGDRVSLLPRSNEQWRRGLRQCPHCQAWLELANSAGLYGALTGAGAGGLLILAARWPVGPLWLRLAAVVVLTWLVSLLLLQRAVYWRVIPGPLPEAPEVKRWSRRTWAGLYLSLAALVLLFAAASLADSIAAADRQQLLVLVAACYLAAALGLGIAIYASMRRQGARSAQVASHRRAPDLPSSYGEGVRPPEGNP